MVLDQSVGAKAPSASRMERWRRTIVDTILVVADLVCKPLLPGLRCDSRGGATPRLGGVTSESLTDDLEGVRALCTALLDSIRDRLTPTQAWSRLGHSDIILLDAISMLLGVSFWSGVLDFILIAPFAPEPATYVMINAGWSVFMWVFFRRESVDADLQLIPYFLVLVNMFFSAHMLVSHAWLVLPIAFYGVRLLALVMLGYALPIRLGYTLVYATFMDLEEASCDAPRAVAAAPSQTAGRRVKRRPTKEKTGPASRKARASKDRVSKSLAPSSAGTSGAPSAESPVAPRAEQLAVVRSCPPPRDAAAATGASLGAGELLAA